MTIEQTISKIKTGDILSITADNKTSTVRVTGIEGKFIWITSGRKLFGTEYVGCIHTEFLEFSPTVRQQVRSIKDVQIVGAVSA